LQALAALLGLALLFGGSLARAQAPQLPPDTRPTEKPLPSPELGRPPAHLLELPRLAPPDAERLPYALRVRVREFRVTGNTVFSDAELAAIAAPFANREITGSDLEALRQRLTLHYVERGYVNSGAVIPDQRIVDGVVEIRIVEGRLVRVDVEGTEHFRPGYFSDRLALRAGPPLNVAALEQELQILLQDPLVSSINARLVPGERPGEAILRARVAEAPRYDFGVSLDNRLSPSLGEAALGLHAEARNLAGRGDVLGADLGAAEGIRHDAKLRYRIPLTARDTALGLYYEHAESEVVEEPFNVLDITSEIETAGVQLSHPVYRTPNRELRLGAALERREALTTLLGEPFSFSSGVVEGKSVVSVLRLIQEFVDRGRNHAIAARSTLSAGLDAFGSTVHADAPDSRFLTWLGQLQWVGRLNERGHQLHARANVQIADDSLLPLEQFSVGGLDSVRGFRTNQLVRDYGYATSLEYRLPLFANPTGWRNLQLAAFVDVGGARNRRGPSPDPTTLAGIGAGLIWSPSPRLHAEIYFADGRTAVPSPSEDSLQDESVYFRILAYPLRPR